MKSNEIRRSITSTYNHNKVFRHMFCFPLWVCACLPIVTLCLFGCIISPFVAGLDATMSMKSHLRDVGILVACLSLVRLALHVRVSCISLIYAL